MEMGDSEDLKLKVQIVKATNLPNVEKKRDSSDPYVKITFKCQSTLTSYYTEVQNKGPFCTFILFFWRFTLCVTVSKMRFLLFSLFSQNFETTIKILGLRGRQCEFWTSWTVQ